MPRLDWCELAVIFASGFLGALARVVLVQDHAGHPGQLAMGDVKSACPMSAYRRLLLGTGLCGVLTTFSTLQLELLQYMCG